MNLIISLSIALNWLMCSFFFWHYWSVFLKGWFRKCCGNVKRNKVTLEAFVCKTRHKRGELRKTRC
jgi:hypothetical protein